MERLLAIDITQLRHMTKKIKEHGQLNKKSNYCIVVLSSCRDLSNLKSVGDNL
jgi:hypothetical protein